jgi:hypothetical protein
MLMNDHNHGEFEKVYPKKEEAMKSHILKIINFHNDIITSTRSALY